MTTIINVSTSHQTVIYDVAITINKVIFYCRKTIGKTLYTFSNFYVNLASISASLTQAKIIQPLGQLFFVCLPPTAIANLLVGFFKKKK